MLHAEPTTSDTNETSPVDVDGDVSGGLNKYIYLFSFNILLYNSLHHVHLDLLYTDT